MKSLISIFWGICILRRGPEVAPDHPLFLGILIAADILLGTFLSVRLNTDITWLQGLTYVSVSLASLASATWFLLYLKELPNRFPATLSAIIGCDFMLSMLLFLLSLITGPIASPATLGLAAVIGIWTLWVVGFILHRALDVSLMAGILLSFAMTVFSIALASAASAPV